VADRKDDPKDYDTAGVDLDIAPGLMSLVSPRRFAHCKAVAELAVSLAERWELDVDGARRAGLLHDVWRDRRDDWIEDARREGIQLPAWAQDDIGHLHGPLGARVAAREFSLPPEWVRAIASHTTCRWDVSDGALPTTEEMVLYLADHACEGRRHPQVPHWRKLAHKDLAAAAREMLSDLLGSLLEQGKPLWEPSVLARNALLLHRDPSQAR
jgi:predicted HD superfamily hydrolase involved in NAD metabolism